MGARRSEFGFTEFIAKLLLAQGEYTVDDHLRIGDRRVDLSVTDGNNVVTLIEVKLPTPQTSVRIHQVIEQLHANVATFRYQYPSVNVRSALAVPGVLTEAYKQELHRGGIEVWDGASC